MKGYFHNPELKKSSVILLFFVGIFLVLTFFMLKLQHEQLKEEYIKQLGAISVRVIEKDPQLEKEIIPIITKKVSQEEALGGKATLAQYGLTSKLDNELFPYLNETIRTNYYSIIFVFVAMAVTLMTLNYLQYGFFYKRIRRLTLAAKRVVEGEYNISINEDEEGDFSKLAVSFNSMRDIIRNNIVDLKKEKEFLADILSDISHQLKTPLSSMILYNDLMLNKELSKDQRQTFLLNNQNQLNRMQWLITSLLKLAKLDAKAIVLGKEEESLNETIKDSIEAVESKALLSEVIINFNDGEEIVFNQDKLWLQEAFINIIKNGIEYTPQGGLINIEITENPIYRRVIIEDNGEGIREEDLPNIFKRFYKGKTVKKSDSVGIGLALAKSIIEAHNGMVEAYSRVGEGTKFVITFLKY